VSTHGFYGQLVIATQWWPSLAVDYIVGNVLKLSHS
jgi:hypothetical protein